MKKILFITLLFCGVAASAQTLFTYGTYKVEAKDFLRAFNKNNLQPTGNKAKAISDYLQLFIKSKLKVREAYDKRYDTLPQIVMEVSNLRTQIAENYMTDPALVSKMGKEAFERSQKDIKVSHTFISLRNAAGFIDSVAAQQKLDIVTKRLAKGEDFGKLAQELSDDTTAKKNKGNLGFITVFTLPYEFENAIYATSTGKYSKAVASKIGYHIFKNTGERKAAGKIKAQQILLAFPPMADEATKKQIGKLADSLYKRLLAGDNFNHLASAFSNDYVTAATGGLMPDISVGQYDPAFEAVLWSLPKDGAISKPFTTAYGWHIVKRISKKPVVTDPNDKVNLQELEQKIKADARWKSSNNFIYNQLKAKLPVKRSSYDDAAVWAMSDSVLDYKPMLPAGRSIIATTPLFSIGDSVYDANDWVNYANTYRFKQDGSGAKPWPQVREEFEQFMMVNYYRDHLEDFNEEFKNQMTEFKDGNIFFEIMQQEIWNKAQADTSALLALYENNKKNYLWKQSADAVVFFCADEVTAKMAYDELKKNPSDWKKVADMFTEKVVADSSRYEWDQLPNMNKMAPKAGLITTPVVNKTDNTASFAYIVNVHTQPTQRSFNEARGLVINDYQAVLEQQWDDALRKKYPVVIDQKVLGDISK
jgi:peptidyl-prolyl cis-trans isomerase SurA